MTERRPVAVLGATGVVGQRLVAMLDEHPWFRLAEVVASDRSAGKRYGTAVRWHGAGAPPAPASELELRGPGTCLESGLVFSAVSAQAAREYEPLYAECGHLVVSNASAFRLDPTVPLVIPEVNPDTIDLLSEQRWTDRAGGIVTNPNCCVAGLALALAPIHEAFGLESVVVATLQSLSGAGRPGVPGLDALGNVIPFIRGEQEKIAREPLKILGAEFPISVAVHRVPVVDGHTLTVFAKLARPAGPAEVGEALAAFEGRPVARELPSAPRRPIVVVDGADRPQPALDAGADGGMSVTVGRIEPDPTYDVRFTLVVHNLVRGAAGAALLNAELLAVRGALDRLRPQHATSGESAT